jgi:mannosyl-3-phosphoglycerate phosphatase
MRRIGHINAMRDSLYSGASSAPCSIMVFTDLDGSLLDHDSYAFDAALPALEALAAQAIPVVPVSSKTLAELTPLMAQIGLTGPAIAENGAVIKYANGIIDGAAGRATIHQMLAALPAPMRRAMQCFCDMTPAEIAAVTGLSLASAKLAAQRDATEPFLWHGPADDLPALEKAAAPYGYGVTQGGRFYHLVPPRDKAAAMAEIVETQTPRPEIWALGDGPNDIAMLLRADKGALIANPHIETQNLLPQRHGLLICAQAGPDGWRDAIATFLGRDLG